MSCFIFKLYFRFGLDCRRPKIPIFNNTLWKLILLEWCVFMWYKFVSVFFHNTFLNIARYNILLYDHLHPFINSFYPNDERIFHRENISSYRAHISRNWLDYQFGDFWRMIWPIRDFNGEVYLQEVSYTYKYEEKLGKYWDGS